MRAASWLWRRLNALVSRPLARWLQRARGVPRRREWLFFNWYLAAILAGAALTLSLLTAQISANAALMHHLQRMPTYLAVAAAVNPLLLIPPLACLLYPLIYVCRALFFWRSLLRDHADLAALHAWAYRNPPEALCGLRILPRFTSRLCASRDQHCQELLEMVADQRLLPTIRHCAAQRLGGLDPQVARLARSLLGSQTG